MAKSTKSSTAIQNKTKRVNGSIKDYDMVFSFREYPTSDAYIEDKALRLLQWVEDKDTLIIGEFLEEIKCHPWTWAKWLKRSKILSEAYCYAKMCVGNHRERGALTRKLSEATILQSMPIYNEDWQELREWSARLRDIKQEASVFNIKVANFAEQFKQLKEEQALLEKKEEDARTETEGKGSGGL
jgi:hypothetical protein